MFSSVKIMHCKCQTLTDYRGKKTFEKYFSRTAKIKHTWFNAFIVKTNHFCSCHCVILIILTPLKLFLCATISPPTSAGFCLGLWLGANLNHCWHEDWNNLNQCTLTCYRRVRCVCDLNTQDLEELVGLQPGVCAGSPREWQGGYCTTISAKFPLHVSAGNCLYSRWCKAGAWGVIYCTMHPEKSQTHWLRSHCAQIQIIVDVYNITF